MAWNVEGAKSTFNASEKVANTVTGRNSVRSNVQISVEEAKKLQDKDYSIVGINANKVPAMREAIREYVATIQKHLDGFQESADTAKAFRSESVTTAVKQYMITVQDYCQNLTSQLLAFSDKLQDIKYAWDNATLNMAQSVQNSVTGFNKGETYSEEF